MENITQKRCSRCRKWKSLSEFGRCKTSKDGLSFYCFDCKRSYQTRWDAENAERRREINANWLAQNTERQRELCAKWVAKNADKVRERLRAWRANNAERIKEQRRKRVAEDPEIRSRKRNWWAENAEKVNQRRKEKRLGITEQQRERERERKREWRVKNPDKYLEQVRERRATKIGNGGTITAREWKWLKEFYNFTCLKCGRGEPEIKLELDHVVPLKLGGKNVIQNAQPLCKSCNSSKGAKYIDYRKGRTLWA